MTEREFEVRLDGKFSKRHLLAIIFEYKSPTVSEAARKLTVEKEQIHAWAAQLAEEGLIDYATEDGDDAPMSLTKEGFKILKIIEKNWIAQEQKESETPKSQVKADKKKKMDAARARMKKRFEERGIEVIVLISAVLAIYFTKLFIDSPNVEGLSFILGSLTFSIALVLYSRYQKQMRSKKEIISFVQWLRKNLVTMERSFLLFIIAICMVYTMGMIALHYWHIFFLSDWHLNFLIIATVLLAATTELVYYPKKTIRMMGNFYVGVLLMVVGLMIAVDLLNITEGIFGSRQRIIDLIFGVGFIILAYLNDKKLGVSKVIKRAGMERDKEEKEKEEYKGMSPGMIAAMKAQAAKSDKQIEAEEADD